MASTTSLGPFSVAIGAQYLDYQSQTIGLPYWSYALQVGGHLAATSAVGAFALSTNFRGNRVGAAVKYMDQRFGSIHDDMPALDLGLARDVSRYTFGVAVEKAARQARERLLSVASTELEIAPEDLEIVEGEVRPVGAPGRAITLQEIASKTLTFGSPHEPIEGYGGVAQISRAPGAAGHLSHVRVDPETGSVTLLGHVVAQDVGPISSPDGLRNQLEGGALQGLSRALTEEVTWDDRQITSTDWSTYRTLFVGSPIPAIESVLVERLDSRAMGAGETAITIVAAAVGNAIFDATGVRLRRVPFREARVLAALKAANV